MRYLIEILPIDQTTGVVNYANPRFIDHSDEQTAIAGYKALRKYQDDVFDCFLLAYPKDSECFLDSPQIYNSILGKWELDDLPF